MLNFIKNFRADEDGAVTVDWVVLTAALVILGLVVLQQVNTATNTLTKQVATDLGVANVKAKVTPK
jgi:Flp pilus assembly pilin Flp